jgi:hypothetical protein
VHGLLFATPLAFIGIAVTFARWSYRRTTPYEPFVIGVAILGLTVMTVATSVALQSERARYDTLEQAIDHCERTDDEALSRCTQRLVEQPDDRLVLPGDGTTSATERGN